MTDIRASIGLPPDDTVEAFRAKGVYPVTPNWDAVWQEENARAFYVTKLLDRTLAERVRASLDDAIAKGGTFEQWKAAIVPQLQEAGWYGRVENRPELTGVDYPIFVGRSRLRTIYDTNLRMARAAGKWKRIQALKRVAPYLRYTAILDTRTRPEHRLWHGTILPVDHPWWDTHFPPCGWHCRCNVVQLSDRDLRARGWKVTAEPPGGRNRPWRRSDGTIVQVPNGIDPGFAYNPGKAHMRGLVPPPVEGPLATPAIRPADLPPLPAPRERRETLPDELSDEQAIGRFLARFPGRRAADGTVLTQDAAGEPLILDDRFFRRGEGSPREGALKLRADRKRLLLQLAETLLDPDEIWWTWQSIELANGRTIQRVARRYVARFLIDGQDLPLVVVMQTDADGWRGVTAYVGNNLGYADKEQVRGGWLAYRRQ